MSWRVAKSLEKLLEQINEAAPNRDKSSDGGIGDAAHASRASDHNPWVVDENGIGVVTARDFTHDPAGGCDCPALTNSLVSSRDERIKYIIWDRMIVSSDDWEWRPYKGTNPHTHHAHVSVNTHPAFYDSEDLWQFHLPRPVGTKRVHYATVKRGDRGQVVQYLQANLNLKADGIFGQDTFDAVVAFQKRAGLVPDGVVGRYTWDAILT